MDCQNIEFSPQQSQKRIEKALLIIPLSMLNRILSFALYLLGARLNTIGSLVNMPVESIKTMIKRIMSDGMPAFDDRRQSSSTHTHPLERSSLHPEPQISVSVRGDCCEITFAADHLLIIPLNHRVHLRSVLLSLLQADLLTVPIVSSVLDITPTHCRELSEKLRRLDVTEVLVDKRKGQMQHFRVGLSVKAELIQHFAARAITGHSTSGQALSEIINEHQKTNISPRTIRWHMHKLGLGKIKKTLPNLVSDLKKNS
ncbi:MAG: hypothetical protein HQ517_05835 [SAR324 cluster bacterium]|nr:hypothetical protein [SAR324 cluster bacterium]